MIVKYPKTYFRIIKICSDSFLSNSKLTVRPSLDYYTSFFGEVKYKNRCEVSASNCSL